MTHQLSDAIHEPARRTPVIREVDVCVTGGGAAGVAAAIAAAQSGARVVLLERAGFLGGSLTTVSLGSICGLYAVTDDHLEQIVRGFADQVIARLQRHQGAAAPTRWLKTASLPYDLFTMKVVLDELVAEAGVEVLYHTLVTGAIVDQREVSALLVECKQGRLALRAKTFIDCSGDADVVRHVGAPYEIALDDLQFPTTMVRFGGVDTEQLARMSRDDLRANLERAVGAGLDLPRTTGGVFSERPGIAHLNITKVAIDGRSPDPFDVSVMSRAEATGREQVCLYLEAFQRFVPGFTDAYVLDTGAVIGVRESRRVVGRYVLTDDDVLGGARFEDAIACCAWPMEDHAAGRATRWVWLEPGRYFQIPLRALLLDDLDNLIVAGRCASATHGAQASIRVTAQCFAMGEAAGVLAGLARTQNVAVNDVPVRDVQNNLLSRGAYLGN